MKTLPKKILIVDDDTIARITLERFLIQEGYDVITAVNANDALLAVHVENPDIILSDIYMPGKTGLELHSMITELNLKIPTILMTGQDDMPTTVKAMQQGAYDYLAKPLDLERLKAILA